MKATILLGIIKAIQEDRRTQALKNIRDSLMDKYDFLDTLKTKVIEVNNSKLDTIL